MKNESMQKDTFINAKTLRAGIFGAALSFIIAKLLDPLFNNIYAFFLTFQGSLIKSISDATYREISNGYSEKTSQSVLYLMVIIMCSFLFYIHSKIKDIYTQIIESNAKKYDNAQSIQSSSIADIPETEIINKSSKLIQEADDLKKQAYEILEKSNKVMKRSYHIFNFFLIIGGIFLFFLYSKDAFVINKVTSITNNIEIVSPYITDEEYKQLKSDFHTMKSRDDYDSLTNSLSEIASYNSVELKK